MSVKVISMINMKGGVAKTTLAVNISYALAQFHDMDVLLVDVDPQFNTSQYLVDDEAYLDYTENRKGNTIFNIFFEKRDSPVSTVTRRKKPKKKKKVSLENTTINVYDKKGKLDIVPSTIKLHEAEMMPRGKETKLRTFIKKARDSYDYILIDCPPTISVFTLSAYLASDGYLVPVKPDPLSTIGLPLLEKVISEYSTDFEHSISQVGIVFTMVRKTNLMRDTMAELRRERMKEVFGSLLSYSTHVAEAAHRHKPLFNYSRSHRYGDEIKDITIELLDVLEGK